MTNVIASLSRTQKTNLEEISTTTELSLKLSVRSKKNAGADQSDAKIDKKTRHIIFTPYFMILNKDYKSDAGILHSAFLGMCTGDKRRVRLIYDSGRERYADVHLLMINNRDPKTYKRQVEHPEPYRSEL